MEEDSGGIALLNTIKIGVQKPENRCEGDYVPTLPKDDPKSIDQLVALSLRAFSDKTRVIKKKKKRYKKVGLDTVPKFKFRIDQEAEEKEKQKEAAEGNGDNEPKEQPKLQDMFSPQSPETPKNTGEPLPDVNSLVVPTYEQAKSARKGKLATNTGIFSWFQPDYDYKVSAEQSVVKRVRVDKWKPAPRTQILFQCNKLSLSEFEPFEPFYCSVTLYDISTKVKTRLSGMQKHSMLTYHIMPCSMCSSVSVCSSV